MGLKMCKQVASHRIPTRTRKYQTFISYALSHSLSSCIFINVCLFLSRCIHYAFYRHYVFVYSYFITCYCSIVVFALMTTRLNKLLLLRTAPQLSTLSGCCQLYLDLIATTRSIMGVERHRFLTDRSDHCARSRFICKSVGCSVIWLLFCRSTNTGFGI